MPSCRLKVPDPVILFFFYALLSESTWATSFVNDYFYRKYDVNTSRTQTCGNDTGIAFEAERNAQSVASRWLLYFILSGYVPSILVTLAIGGWSDKVKHGRKLLMIIPSIGGICLISVCLIVVYWEFSIGYLFFGTVLHGLMGGSTLLYNAVYSYISDLYSTKTRTRRLGILSAMMATGAAVGRTVGGVLLQYVGSFALLFACLFSYTFCLLYVFFFLDDPCNITENNNTRGASENENEEITGRISLHDDHGDNGRVSDDRGGCNMESVTGAIQILKSRELNLKPRWCLILLLVVDGLTYLMSDAAPIIEYLYFLGTPLCWNTSIIGYFFGLSYLCLIFGASAVLTVFTNVLQMRDTTIVLVGVLSFVGVFVYIAFVTSTWSMFLVLAISIPSGVVSPTLISMLSKCVVREHQGALFSLSSSVESTNSLLALVIFNPLYSAVNQDNIDFLPNSGAFTFLVMAFVYTIIFVLTLILHFSKSWKSSLTREIESEESVLINPDNET